MSTGRGPYVNEEGGVFLPVAGWTLNEARHAAAALAREDMGENVGRARYTGKCQVPLHDHDDWWDCTACPDEPAWSFETYEGPYR